MVPPARGYIMEDRRPDAIRYWQDGIDAQSIAGSDCIWAVMSRSGLCFVSIGFVYGCFEAGVTTAFMRFLLFPRVMLDGDAHPRAFRTSHHRR